MKQRAEIKIFPSILSADFSKLQDEIKLAEVSGADGIHCDIMDGHFVPNITFGPMVVSTVNKITEIPIDVHLMINNSEKFIDDFVKAGADYISVHYENNYHIDRLLNYIRSKNVQAGVVINPATDTECLRTIIKSADFVLVMSVNPGFGGQKYINYSTEKIYRLKEMIKSVNPECMIEVDGGIGSENISDVYEAGADIVIAGASVYKAANKSEIISEMKKKCN